MKRFDHRARVSASLHNRTLDAVDCMDEVLTRFGGGQATTKIHHWANAQYRALHSHYSDDPVSGWTRNPTAEPVAIPYGDSFGGSWGAAANSYAYALASILRTDYPEKFGHLTGADFLLNGSGLTHNAVGTPWVFGESLPYEGDEGVLITESPDNWTYPGGFDHLGVAFTGNPAASGGGPGWSAARETDWFYKWYPAFDVGGVPNRVYSAFPLVTGGADWFAYLEISANVAPIGLSPEMVNWPDGTVIHNARAEVNGGALELVTQTFARPSYSEPGVWTTSDPSTSGVSFVLFGARRSGGFVQWSPVGAGVPGTLSASWSVVDVTAIVQQMFALRHSGYFAFALVPAFVADLVGAQGGGAAALKALHTPPTYSAAPDGSPYVSAASGFYLTWDTIALGTLHIKYTLPASEAGRSVCVPPLPVMVDVP